MAFPFELSVDLSTLAILAMVAFIAGFIDAIAGGGGLLTIPALLTAGLPPHLALGTNKLSSTFGSAAASYTFYRRKLFDPGQWRNALIGTAVGALLGAAMAQWLPSEWLNQLLPAVVFGCGLYLLFGGTPKTPLTYKFKIHQGGYYHLHLRARARLDGADTSRVAVEDHELDLRRIAGRWLREGRPEILLHDVRDPADLEEAGEKGGQCCAHGALVSPKTFQVVDKRRSCCRNGSGCCNSC